MSATVLKIPESRPQAQISGPVQGILMTPEYVRTIGRLAYLWGWPMMSSFNRRVALTSCPEPGLRGGILPNAPRGQICMLTDYISADQRFVTCSNQDVVYGFGFGSLDEEPVVMQVPEFGDRFWVYAAWDARTDSFAELGKQYGTRPGFYLLVGPNWNGKLPSGISKVFRSSTELAAMCPRVFMNDTVEDREAIQPLLNQVVAYPLSHFDGKMKTKDWKKVPNLPAPPMHGDEEVKWVRPETFFDQLPNVIKNVAPLPGEEALYALIDSVLQASENDSDLKKTLQETAIQAEKDLIEPLRQWRLNGPSAGNGWYSAKNNSQFGTDYLTRTAIAKSNMYENAPQETKYIFTDTDAQGDPLDGNSLYSITFPKEQLPPVNGFWSLTLYNQYHFFNPNALHRFSLGTKNNTLRLNANGSLTLYAGAQSPGKDKETNWLPAPRTPFSLYIRAYWGKPEIVNGAWKPPIVEQMK